MDVDQIGELRAWATRLDERAESDELRAAAKAILMLAEEVEELQARLIVATAATPSPADEVQPPVAPAPGPAPREARRRSAGPSLLARIRRAFGLD